ncbi:MAG: transposase [Dehalococcoidia bacterium]|nr:MAG: transposase [Dehalococcoidia bacterium]
MPENNTRDRRSIRLSGYDYAQNGAYFITICTHGKRNMFGEIVDGDVRLNECGRIVHMCLLEIPKHFSNASLDEFIVMPNHIHAIISIDAASRGTACRAPTERFGKPTANSIPTIIRSLKSAAARRINVLRQTPGAPVWHRNYYEHVIRGETDLNSVREYVRYNPQKWAEDEENPAKSANGISQGRR